MNNKLYSEIENKIHESWWMENDFQGNNTFEDGKNNFQEINTRIAAEKLYQLTEDVAIKFAAYVINNPYGKDIGKDSETFKYFIEKIYTQKQTTNE